MRVKQWLKIVFLLAAVSLLLSFSNFQPGDQLERVRAYSRNLEFDFVGLILESLGTKIKQVALNVPNFLTPEQQSQIVLDYLDLIARIRQLESNLTNIYADPDTSNPEEASAVLRDQLEDLTAERERLAPIAESILQNQISVTVADLGLTLGGQPLPPVLYRTSSLPTALIVSPREVIKREYHIPLEPDISIDERTELEDTIDEDLDVSSLVVDVGGIGVYPTMVIETSNINTLTEFVAHEWIHNYLTLRPLGINIMTSPELLTMNETAANLAGIEVGRAVMERFYPELLPPPPSPPSEETAEEAHPPVFDFREQMRETRETVDQLLAEGKIEQAEEYMEARRKIFWENGYRLRKINQAFFAFYGSYADQPGGPAGEDPVGEAVRALYGQSPTLADFLKRISWMTSFEDLQRAVDTNAN
jgi:hypothetical protein